MIKRLFCKHEWIKTYDGTFIASEFVCIKCGKSVDIYPHREYGWQIKRILKGETFYND